MNNWPRYIWIFDAGKIIIYMLASIVLLPFLIPLLILFWVSEKMPKKPRSVVVEMEPARRLHMMTRKTKQHKRKRKRRGV